VDKRKFLTDDERQNLENILIEHLEDDTRNVVLLLTMLYSGARPQEILELSWNDIDVDSGEIFLATLKGGKQRFVVVPKHVCAALKRLKTLKPDKPFGLSYSMFVNIWKTYRPCKKTIRSMRHTFAVNALKKTKNIHFVQRALGHRSINSTMVYLDYDYSTQEFKKLMRVR
jgi:integrase/recombinase XerD